MTSLALKTTFAIENKYDAFYTGGRVQVSKDGVHMFCQCDTQIKILEVATGKVIQTIGEEEDDEITCFCVSPNDEVLVVASRKLLIKQWNWKENLMTRSWKAIHVGPIVRMEFDVTSTLLATGSSDSTIKVWDIVRQYCTHNLTGHQGVVSALAFQQEGEKLRLVSAADDYQLRVWDLVTSSCLAVLEGHFSVVTSLYIDTQDRLLYSASRDNVVILWNIDDLSKTRTIPVYESVEALIVLPKKTYANLNVNTDHRFFVTAGSKGVLRVWNASSGACVFNNSSPEIAAPESKDTDDSEQNELSIVSAAYHEQLNVIVAVTFDHNICFHAVDTLEPQKHFVGNTDDVLDIKFLGQSDSHLAVATNSELIKVFEASTWNCQVLKGHTDIIMSIDVYKDGSMLVSASKDNTIRVWWFDEDTGLVRCVAVGHGHTHAVLSVAFSRLSCKFVVTGSQDNTIKLWPLPDSYPASGPPARLSSVVTEHAHEKDINSIAVAPNDKLIATGSLDRTAKLWQKDDLKLVGVFRGHRRGIWSVQFSPVDQCLATTSADSTIKLWALSDFTCVKTFEGHQSSVLRLCFLSRGMQLMSSGSDGLIKLWTLKSNECVQTLDAHGDKIWALTCSKTGDKIVSGAGDAVINVWKDVTEEQQIEERTKKEDFIVKEQKLANLIHEKKWVKALSLTITLNQPFRALSVIRALLEEDEGEENLEITLAKLRLDQIGTMLTYCSEWNTNSRNCHVAQIVINIVLRAMSPQELLQLPNIKEFIEAIIPYTERHFERMSRLQQQASFVDYTWQTMKLKEDLGSLSISNEDGFTVDRNPSSLKSQMRGLRGIASAADKSESETSSEESDDNRRVKKSRKVSRKESESDSSDSSEESEEETVEVLQKLEGSTSSESSDEDMETENRVGGDNEKENIKGNLSQHKTQVTSKIQTPKSVKRQKTPKTDPVKKQKSLTGSSRTRRRRSMAK